MKTISELECAWEKLYKAQKTHYVVRKPIYVVFNFFDSLGLNEPWTAENRPKLDKAIYEQSREERLRFAKYCDEAREILSTVAPSNEDLKKQLEKDLKGGAA